MKLWKILAILTITTMPMSGCNDILEQLQLPSNLEKTKSANPDKPDLEEGRGISPARSSEREDTQDNPILLPQEAVVRLVSYDGEKAILTGEGGCGWAGHSRISILTKIK